MTALFVYIRRNQMKNRRKKIDWAAVVAIVIVAYLIGFLSHIAISMTRAEYHALLLYCDTLQGEVTELTERVIALENAGKLQTDGINAANAATAQEKTVTVPKGEVVWKTSSGEKYHKEGCGSLRGNGVAITVEEATIAGLEPCKRCFK